MPIQFQCPNASCGQVLTVKDEYAGRKGRCPSCGTAVDIPAAKPVPAAPPAEEEKPELEAQPVDEPRRSRADEEEWAVEDAHRIDRGRVVRPASRAGADRFRRRGPGGTGALVAGAIALIVLAFVPYLSWTWTFESDSRSRGGGFDNRPLQNRMQDSMRSFGLEMMAKMAGDFMGSGVGGAFLILSALTAVLAVYALAVSASLQPEAAEALITTSSSAGVFWGTTALLWIVGFGWRVFTMWSDLTDLGGGRGGSSGLVIIPGIGLWLGFVAAVLVVIACSYLLASRGKAAFMLAAGGAGFLLGVLLVVFGVKPWTVPFFGPGLF
jgi:hypothetical protein